MATLSSVESDRAGAEAAGPIEERHMQSEAYRNATVTERLTPTHWHIASANFMGWGFDGMDGAMFALVAPLVIADFKLGISDWRTGVQLAMIGGIVGTYLWPWLADRYGRRNLLAINIGLFSLSMPLVALAPTYVAFIAAYALCRFALAGEWAIGSMLVAETWPARLRGRVLSINRSSWGLGAALAGGITAYIAANWGWRGAFLVPGAVALLAIYVRLKCPESPYWVRTMDRKNRIKEQQAQGQPLSPDDAAWIGKANKVGIRQLFLPDTRQSTFLATFVATMNLIAFSTVGYWMPLYLKETHGWSTAEYSSFYAAWGLAGVVGIVIAGWLIDRFGRRPGFVIALLQGAFFITLWCVTTDRMWLWIWGLLWSLGFLGIWGPATAYTAEMYPTRIRGVGNGFSWGVALFVGYLLWPFVSVWIHQATGSFTLAFLLIPVAMLLQALVVWVWSPEHAGKDLDEISI
ncbi:MAG: MFS transporter [Hyphomicrobiaceae bacterium]